MRTPEEMLHPGSERCMCAECGRYFSTTRNFDRHRIFIDKDVQDWDRRRCLTPAEMKAKGLIEKDGVWKQPGPEQQPQRRPFVDAAFSSESIPAVDVEA